MKTHIRQETIEILRNEEQKKQREDGLRHLWKSCFHDPEHYEDFYFDKVYTQNIVYALSDKGMIHVNSYRCRVLNEELTLPYIVGVATDEQYRRQGIMRRLMEQVLSDMYDEGVPFTYLMPADEKYYRDFAFSSVSYRVEDELDNMSASPVEDLHYVSYSEMKQFSAAEKMCLFEKLECWLDSQYDIYAVHDESYYDLLYAEKSCQSGDVIFCFRRSFNEEVLCGVFAYAMDGDMPCVEQFIAFDEKTEGCDNLEERMRPELASDILCSYFKGYEKVKVVLSFPYMIRIVNREAFLKLFANRLRENSHIPCEEMTSEQMIECLFKGKNNIYFAEIV